MKNEDEKTTGIGHENENDAEAIGFILDNSNGGPVEKSEGQNKTRLVFSPKQAKLSVNLYKFFHLRLAHWRRCLTIANI